MTARRRQHPSWAAAFSLPSFALRAGRRRHATRRKIRLGVPAFTKWHGRKAGVHLMESTVRARHRGHRGRSFAAPPLALATSAATSPAQARCFRLAPVGCFLTGRPSFLLMTFIAPCFGRAGPAASIVRRRGGVYFRPLAIWSNSVRRRTVVTPSRRRCQAVSSPSSRVRDNRRSAAPRPAGSL